MDNFSINKLIVIAIEKLKFAKQTVNKRIRLEITKWVLSFMKQITWLECRNGVVTQPDVFPCKIFSFKRHKILLLSTHGSIEHFKLPNPVVISYSWCLLPFYFHFTKLFLVCCYHTTNRSQISDVCFSTRRESKFVLDCRINPPFQKIVYYSHVPFLKSSH